MLTAHDSAIIKTMLIFGHSDCVERPQSICSPSSNNLSAGGRDVGFPGNPHIQRRKEEDAHDEGGNQTANDDDGTEPAAS
jgi:hypothetical protein